MWTLISRRAEGNGFYLLRMEEELTLARNLVVYWFALKFILITNSPHKLSSLKVGVESPSLKWKSISCYPTTEFVANASL